MNAILSTSGSRLLAQWLSRATWVASDFGRLWLPRAVAAGRQRDATRERAYGSVGRRRRLGAGWV